MNDMKVLVRAGYDQEKLKNLFLPKGGDAARKPEIARLIDTVASRIRGGVNGNLRNSRWFWAIDQACDVTQEQISTTLAKGLIGRSKMDRAQINAAVQDWGLSSFLTPDIDPQTKLPKVDSRGQPLMTLDAPVFSDIKIPLATQYMEIRLSTLVDGRDQSPFFKFQPLVFSKSGHVKSELITSRIERMTMDMGYRSDFRQEVLTMLKYGISMSFAREPYYREVQLREIQNEQGESVMDPVVVREGIRYDYPHPSRSFIDMSQKAQSINTDTGVSYAGYWDVYRYGDVVDNKRYWFTDDERNEGKAVGSMSWLENSAWDMYSKLYPCTIEMPSQLIGGVGGGRSELDRTAEAFRYTYNQRDNGVVLTKYYMKLVPKNYELFDYGGPVWFCFTMINDRTPILVEPYCYCPVRCCQYNADQGLYRNPSMINVILPFQDQISNLVSQYLLTVRRNLINLIWYNKDAVSQDVINKLERLGKELYTDINLVGISFREMSYEPTAGEPQNLFRPVQFSVQSPNDLVSAMSSVLDLLERAIGFTAQEVGSVASHVQTAEEVKTVKGYQNARVVLTDTYVDSSVQAWKEQLYAGLMAYGDDIIMAEISDMNDVNPQDLEDMGFQVEVSPDRRAGVIGPKGALSMSGFASDREGSRRSDDSQLANGLMQFAQTLFSVPEVVQQMGISGIVDMFNTVASFAGLPPEARIRPPTPEQEQAKKMEQLQMEMMKQQAGAPQEGAPQEPQQPQQPQPPPEEAIFARVQEMHQQEMEKMGEELRTVIEPMAQQIQEAQAMAAQSAQRAQMLEQVIQQMFAQMGMARGGVPPPGI